MRAPHGAIRSATSGTPGSDPIYPRALFVNHFCSVRVCQSLRGYASLTTTNELFEQE